MSNTDSWQSETSSSKDNQNRRKVSQIFTFERSSRGRNELSKPLAWAINDSLIFDKNLKWSSWRRNLCRIKFWWFFLHRQSGLLGYYIRAVASSSLSLSVLHTRRTLQSNSGTSTVASKILYGFASHTDTHFFPTLSRTHALKHTHTCSTGEHCMGVRWKLVATDVVQRDSEASLALLLLLQSETKVCEAR